VTGGWTSRFSWYAASAASGVAEPTRTIASSTSFWRILEAWGCATGLHCSGAWGRPASMAAWARSRSFAFLLKKVFDADWTPYCCSP